MTPPEHLLIGFSIGNIFYAIQTFFKKKYLPYLFVIFVSGIFAIIPDADSFFGNYISTDVYAGHRGITHSVLFVFALSALISFLVVVLVFLKRLFYKREISNLHLFISFMFSLIFLSGLSHLIADLPQPPGVWKGIPLFYPHQTGESFSRVGGWSKIGWYDYKIFWTLFYSVSVSFIMIAACFILRKLSYSKFTKILSILIIVFNITVFIWLSSYIANSEYINPKQWDQQQSEYLKNSNRIISGLTTSGKDCFLKIFRIIK